MLSVVITTHHDPATCYLTVAAVEAQLNERGLDYEVIVVADGGTETKWENQGVTCLRVSTGSPQGSRDVGIKAAKYPSVLVLESHVVVSNIPAFLLEHERLGSTITFPIRTAEGPEMFDIYAHETNWDGDLWYKRVIYSPIRKVNYRVAQFGHSCFLIDRKWYLESGGYTELLTGWGGEEPLLCLKAWMLGRECWQIPTVWHAHYLMPGAHQDKPDLAKNLAIVGYVIAGRKKSGLTITPAMEAERRKICAGPLAGDLNRLRSHLKLLEVPYA
jgi:Glycosyl transferase family 2